VTPIPFGLQPDCEVAIFVLRTEYVISVTHPKHIYHKLLLITRPSFARFGGLTRIFNFKSLV